MISSYVIAASLAKAAQNVQPPSNLRPTLVENSQRAYQNADYNARAWLQLHGGGKHLTIRQLPDDHQTPQCLRGSGRAYILVFEGSRVVEELVCSTYSKEIGCEHAYAGLVKPKLDSTGCAVPSSMPSRIPQIER